MENVARCDSHDYITWYEIPSWQGLTIYSTEGIMLSEISQRKTNTIWFHMYMESKEKQNKSQETNKKTIQMKKRTKKQKLPHIIVAWSNTHLLLHFPWISLAGSSVQGLPKLKSKYGGCVLFQELNWESASKLIDRVHCLAGVWLKPWVLSPSLLVPGHDSQHPVCFSFFLTSRGTSFSSLLTDFKKNYYFKLKYSLYIMLYWFQQYSVVT